MRYLFIDESGDIGDPLVVGNSQDFCLGVCVCSLENLEEVNLKVRKLMVHLKKKELRFSKLSSRDVVISKEFFKNLGIEYYTQYMRKSVSHQNDIFLKKVFGDLIYSMDKVESEKVVVFIDGTENAYFRKIYEPIIRKKFPRATVKFANSMKTPLIQVADFYAGYRRRVEKK